MEIGQGLSCASKKEIEGEIKYIKSPQNVVELIKIGPSGKICLIEHAGATTLGPIFSQISGILCTTGSKGSHLAIMSREFEIPAFMACRFTLSLNELDGKRVKLQTQQDEVTGSVFLLNE
jgi:signal transduction protein with GAF and PtsI domain